MNNDKRYHIGITPDRVDKSSQKSHYNSPPVDHKDGADRRGG